MAPSAFAQFAGSGLQVAVMMVAILGIVIFVHELGHFLAARSCGVTVLKFSLGMGPELIGFTHEGTRYCIAWVPLGGFVQMAGDSPNEDGSMPVGGPEQFLTHPWPGRLWIAVAGPLMNLVTGFIVMVVMCITGITLPDYPNLIGGVKPGTFADKAGLHAGDRILRMNGREVSTWHEIEQAARDRDHHEPLDLDLERGTASLQIRVPAVQVRSVLLGLEPQPSPPIIGSLLTGLPAYRAGMLEGDRILAVNGHAVATFGEVGTVVRVNADRIVHLQVLRKGRTFDLDVKPITQGATDGRNDGIIGIEPPRAMTWVRHFKPGEALSAGFSGTVDLIRTVYEGMWLSLTRPLYYREYVGGPIYIAQMARDSARKGTDQLLYFLAMINIAVMAFNLLPVPMLDGGHITLAFLEGIRRRALSAVAYNNFQKVGFVLVSTLFVLILSKDIVRPFQRQHAVDASSRETTTVAPAPH